MQKHDIGFQKIIKNAKLNPAPLSKYERRERKQHDRRVSADDLWQKHRRTPRTWEPADYFGWLYRIHGQPATKTQVGVPTDGGSIPRPAGRRVLRKEGGRSEERNKETGTGGGQRD